jgi:hypothetical protein
MSLSCKPQFTIRLACPEDANRFWFDKLRTNGWHIEGLRANGKCKEALDALL